MSFAAVEGSNAEDRPDEAAALDEPDSGFIDIAQASTPHPTVIGPYQVVGILGGGSMATLYVANRRCRFGYVQRVVLKRVNRSRADAEMLQEMLLDEARAMASFGHPNLVALHDVGEDDDGVFLALEYVEGTDLRRVNAKLRERREALPFELACFIVAEVLRGLNHAHTARDPDGRPLEIVHRDVNPSNVLISESGQVKLTDFGVVRMRDRVQSKTEAGLVKGKYAYLAPEYISGNPSTIATDLYAAGIMLFELLTGRECYTGKSAYEVMWKIVNKGVPMYRLDREGVPEDLQKIVARSTHVEPERRYKSAQDMANALESWMVKNRRHATPWVLSVFFERHGLLPTAEERPAPMVPLANLQDAVGDGPAQPPPAPELEPIDLTDLGEQTTRKTRSDSDLTGTPPPAETPRRSQRGFTISTSQPDLPTEGWAEPSPSDPIDGGLSMRDPYQGDPTPMPVLEDMPILQSFEEPPPTTPPPLRTDEPEPAGEDEPEIDFDPPMEVEDTAPPEAYVSAETMEIPPNSGSVPVDLPRSGKLEEVPAVDVIEAYCSSECSGVLEFRCGLIWKRVRLDQGVPTGITSNMGMELIGEHLVKARMISRQQLESALEDSERSARTLTQTLLDQGAIDRHRLEVELGKNLAARLQEVLEWRWGTFEYHDRPVPSAEILPRLDLPELLNRAREDRSDSEPHGRPHTPSDSVSPQRKLREALQVARSIADSSGKGRVDRPWRSKDS